MNRITIALCVVVASVAMASLGYDRVEGNEQDRIIRESQDAINAMQADLEGAGVDDSYPLLLDNAATNLMMQSGSITKTGTITAVSFGTKFATTPRVWITQTALFTQDATNANWLGVASVTTNGFNAYIQTNADWLAIGPK